MKTFDVYPLYNITPVKAEGSYVWDNKGEKYLDFYGGHAVISIGHSHPAYLNAITTQLNKIGFYSNAVQLPLQQELAEKLGAVSGYNNYNLFLCNSGAEANENALKLASFYNGRKKIIAFKGSFHGRTSLAVGATDDPKIIAPVNQNPNIVFLPLNNEEAFEKEIDSKTCAVIIEGIQGVGGIQTPSPAFLNKIQMLCKLYNVVFILDEVQSGYGRSGKFFAHQYAGIQPQLITTAKGMGNGFPVAGVLIHPDIQAKHGMLGTTFGGNYLACAAAIAVLDVIEKEKLMENALLIGEYIKQQLKGYSGIKEIRGTGLMLGIELETSGEQVRKQLLFEHKIFTGSSSNKNTVRLLPALNIGVTEATVFLNAFSQVMSNQTIQA